MALIVACLCHDLDHRGTNSSFLSKTGSPLSNLYHDPILENHHFNQTVALLQIEGINIFSHLTDEEYSQVPTVLSIVCIANGNLHSWKKLKNHVNHSICETLITLCACAIQ